uniref:SERPIN domain-containing protein n=1 Tax=Macrostomum lignano TaxID=282301 RepID=A0A1I8FXQ9_9PLAT
YIDSWKATQSVKLQERFSGVSLSALQDLFIRQAAKRFKSMSAAQLRIPGLGRSFTLGSLYNTKTNELIQGIKIFSREELENMVCKHRNDSMECEFVKENSMSDRAKNLDISGELSLSLLSGFITASGTGRHLTDSKQTSQTESLTFRI